MKKILALLLVLALSQTLVACGSGKKDAASTGSYKVAMVTDYGDITDQSFNQTTYEACKAFCGRLVIRPVLITLPPIL